MIAKLEPPVLLPSVDTIPSLCCRQEIKQPETTCKIFFFSPESPS